MVTFTCTVARWRSAVGTTCRTRPRNDVSGYASSVIRAFWSLVTRPIYASFTSTSTSSVERSAIVTTAPRVSPPPTEGATTSPTSASFRSTVPVKGARITVFSNDACAKRSAAWADSTRACAASARASAWAALAELASASCGDTRSGRWARILVIRSDSRFAWSRSLWASMSWARAVERLARACSAAAA